MDEKRLIEEIISEVKERLSAPELTGSCCGIPLTAAVIGELPEKERGILDRSWKTVSWDAAAAADLVLLAETSLELLSELALGTAVSREGQAVLRRLLKGGRVCILEQGLEYRRYKSKAHKSLYLVYQEYEDAVCRHGARIIGSVADLGQKGQAVSAKAGFLDLGSLKLLRESDLIRAKSQGYLRILLDSHTIVTPLAEDYIANHGLLIERRSGL